MSNMGQRVITTSSGVRIGSAYQPKLEPRHAQWIERHTPNKRSLLASPAFWIGAAFSIAVWGLLAACVMWGG